MIYFVFNPTPEQNYINCTQTSHWLAGYSEFQHQATDQLWHGELPWPPDLVMASREGHIAFMNQAK